MITAPPGLEIAKSSSRRHCGVSDSSSLSRSSKKVGLDKNFKEQKMVNQKNFDLKILEKQKCLFEQCV